MNRREWLRTCRADAAANVGYPKSQLVLVMFRTAQFLRGRDGVGRGAYLVVGSIYKIASEWILGIELPARTRVGPGLRIRHGIGVVVNPTAVIGANVMIRQGVTIGNRKRDDDCPVIHDDVEIGANAVIIGDVVVGTGSRIGAGAVITHDVPEGATAILRGTTILKDRKGAPHAGVGVHPIGHGSEMEGQ